LRPATAGELEIDMNAQPRVRKVARMIEEYE
jgi:hypothetical protein